jgi:hypothetical protein
MLVRRYLHRTLTIGLAGAVAYLALTRQAVQQWAGAPRHDPMGSASSAQNPLDAAQLHAPSAERDLGSLGRALLHQALSADTTAPSSTGPDSPLAAARATLDQRLVSAAPNPSETSRLEGMLRPVLDPTLLGEAVAELRCGATLCKVTLIAEDDSRVARAVSSLSERLPKAFSAVVVYPESAGRKSFYLATNPADLELSPVTDVLAQQKDTK